MKKALLLIDLQNDYFSGGKFPLWNTDAVLANIEQAIKSARTKGISVIHIQHTAISKSAEKYKVSILLDCCTIVDEMLHNIALHAVSTRVLLVPARDAI